MKDGSLPAGQLIAAPVDARLEGAIAQVEAVLGAVQELKAWDPEGWRLLRATCLDLRGMLTLRMEKAGRGDPSAEASKPSWAEVAETLARIRVLLDRLSLPKAAWEGWWATACRLKLLEARLLRGKGKTAVA